MVIFPNDFFNITLDLIWLLVLMLLAFHGSIWQKLAAVAVLYPLAVSQNLFVMDMLGALYGGLIYGDGVDFILEKQ